MAEAGWPLREETFYYSHRQNGPHLLPVDIKEYIKNIFKKWHNNSTSSTALKKLIKTSGLHAGVWFKYFYDLKDPFKELKINTIPKGSWFFDKDPVFTVTGPSFLLSWLEPQILQLNYKIQIATLIANSKPQQNINRIDLVTCNKQKEIIEETIDETCALGYNFQKIKIYVKPDEYILNVESRVRQLINAVGGDNNRLFEVGLRAATCQEQHNLTLEGCKRAGLMFTSDTLGAITYEMKSVGTMGHEHVQRFGLDETAFSAMTDRLPGSIFCLLDTYDTIKSGIPAAFKLIKNQPERNHAIRFDSGDIKSQLLFATVKAKTLDIEPRYCLEDGWNLEKTKEFEKLRTELEVPANKFLYGFGGYIVNCGWTGLTRDRVSAVWKLSQTGNDSVMKISKCGKESIPGKPVLWKLKDINSKNNFHRTIIAQEGEDINNEFYQNVYELQQELTIPKVKLNSHGVYSNETAWLKCCLKAKQRRAAF